MDPRGDGTIDFDEWYAAERPRLVALLIRTGHTSSEAEEVADEAMARALARWHRVSGMTSPAGWVTVVAFNLARRRGARSSREKALLASSQGVRSISDHAEGADPDLWGAVRGLPSRQRSMVILRYVHDLPEADIAKLLKVRRGTVASGLHDARRSLAKSLGSREQRDAPTNPFSRVDAGQLAQIKEGA